MNPTGKVQHVIVLMLENRSFDHMLGFLQSAEHEIDGLLGTEFNYVTPTDTSSERVLASDDAPYVPDLDPGPPL
jgi:phospholipase C